MFLRYDYMSGYFSCGLASLINGLKELKSMLLWSARSFTLRIVVILILMNLTHSVQATTWDGIDYGHFLQATRNEPLEKIIKNAWGCVGRERYDSAAAYYSVAASLFSESLSDADKMRCAIANVNMGYIWLSWRMNAAEAYPWLMRARDIASKYKFPDIETSVISNLGQIYFDYNNLPKAVELYHETLLRIMQERGDRYFGRALIDFVAAAIADSRLDLIREATEATAQYRLSDDAPLASYSKCIDAALRRLVAGDSAGAADTLRNALPLFDVTTDRKRYLALHHSITAHFLMLAGKYKDATEELNKLTDIASHEGYYNLLEKGYDDLEECYKAIGDTTAMRDYQYQAMHIRDSLFSASRFETVKDLEIAGQLQGMHEIVSRAAHDAEAQRQRMMWMGITGVVLLGALVCLFISHRRLWSAYREIFRRNMELTGQHTFTTDCQSGINRHDGAKETSVDLESAKEVLTKVVKIMETNREIFNCDFSVDRLAELIGEKPKTVSQSINIEGNKNFNTLLGEYRVREACRMLADPEKMKLSTVESVAESVGYKSRTYFSKVFKNVTGLTPTQFVKQAKNEVRKV